MATREVISIIISNYNYCQFLSAAIDSALGQYDAGVLDVVVVDDGSVDESRRIIRGYGHKIRAVFKQNGGQASALNAGVVEARGDLVLFLDADDMLLPRAASTVRAAYVDGTARIQFPLEVVDRAGARLGWQIGASRITDVTLGPFILDSPTSGNAFSKSVLTKIMPIPEADWRICADAFLMATSSLFGKVTSLSQPLALYRIHGTNNFMANTGALRGTREALARDLRLQSVLTKLAPEIASTWERWLDAYPQHWARRIASLRESPMDHPWPDTLLGLVRKSLRATWRHPYWNVRRKLAYSAWVLAVGAAPRRAQRALRRVENLGLNSLIKSYLGPIAITTWDEL
jgi:glycosyltransferase involved in cell wall biosynthesis